LSAAQTGSSDADHLNTTNLVSGNFQLNWAAYNDSAMDDRLDLAGWTTGAANYIRIYTPTLTTEVGISQRHTGIANSGFKLAPIDAAVQSFNIIYLQIPYVRIEGIEIDGSGITNATYTSGIRVLKGMTNVGDIRIDSMIIHDLSTSSAGYPWEGTMGIIDLHETSNAGPPMTITNNIIYDLYNNTIEGHIGGILVGSRTTSYVYNNTVYNIFNEGSGASGGPAWGIYAKAWPGGTGNATVIAKNNYCGDVRAPQDPVELCYDQRDNGILTQSYNVSSDSSASGTGSQTLMTDYATYFVDITDGSEDLHLTDTSANLWGSSGEDLSAEFQNDVDGSTRTVPWDISADEHFGSPSGIYYSVGTSLADLRTGSPLISISGGTATLDVSQLGNIGVGDVIDYDFDNKKVYIKSVTSSTEFEVQTVDGGTPGNITDATVNSIKRVFNTIQDAVDNSGGASYLDTFNLVSGNYQLTWVAYNDGPFDEVVIIDGYSVDSAHNVTLTVAEGNRHDGTAGTGVRNIVTGDVDVMTINISHTSVHWFEMRYTGSSQSYTVVNTGAGIYGTDLRYLMIHDVPGTGIDLMDAGGTSYIINSIFYDISEANTKNAINIGADLGTILVYNNTIQNSYKAVEAWNPPIVEVRNTVCLDHIGECFDADVDIQSNNASSDTTASGAGSLTTQNAVNYFVSTTPGSEDLHLKFGAPAIEAGTDLSAVLTDDIDGESRPIDTDWDMGADEKDTITPTATPTPTSTPTSTDTPTPTATSTSTPTPTPTATSTSTSTPTNTPTATATSVAGWWDCDWGYRKPITIYASQVPSDQTNFPVLIHLPSDTDLAADAQGNGFDIVFTDDIGTKLSHEREAFDGGSGELTAWVKIVNLSSTVDTVIYMYYGNLSAGDQQDTFNVWSNGYEGVWHLEETAVDEQTTATHNNSSSVDNDGSQFENESTAGKIAGAQYVELDDYINVPHHTSIDFGANEDFTISVWLNSTQTQMTNRWPMVVSKEDGMLATVACSGVVDGTWHYVVGVRDGSDILSYLDGGYKNTTADAGGSLSKNQPFRMGASSVGGAWSEYEGMIDEVRISSVARNADWITTEFNNQSSPSTFHSTPGAEVSSSGFCSATATPTSTATDTPTATATQTATSTSTPTATATPTSTPTLPNPGTSLVSAAPASIPNDGATSSTITVQLRDSQLNDITSGGDTVTLFTDLGILSGVTDNGDGTYTATLTSDTTGLATISGTVNGYWLVDTDEVTVTALAWVQCDYQYRKKITIQATQVPADLTNFPVLINLPSDTELAASARDDGFDISFTSDDEVTKIKHQIEDLTATPVSWWHGSMSRTSHPASTLSFICITVTRPPRTRRKPTAYGTRITSASGTSTRAALAI
jgi:hypothetical protein